MPLKHATETALVLLLAVMIALAGFAAAFLPPISVSILPWAAAFAISLIYPMALYPMMRERRADHSFRLLHFVPAAILLVWLALDLLASFVPGLQWLQSWFTWAWALPFVLVAFLALLWYCLNVIRQRAQRMGTLAAVFLPFLLLSLFSERQDWDGRLAGALWEAPQTGTGVIAGNMSGSNLDPSTDMAEEQWRAQLRRMERRRQRLEEEGSSASSESSSVASVRGATSGVIIASGGLPEKPLPKPTDAPHLPSSGFGTEGLALTMLAGCCTAIQRRSMLRKYI